uniref:Uncharacterized protein n=1 Tax=Romanomermis culicivorax TaxID=13658 RepID=A0A915JML3_ROMCU
MAELRTVFFHCFFFFFHIYNTNNIQRSTKLRGKRRQIRG